jgi:predicted acetyltransferase
VVAAYPLRRGEVSSMELTVIDCVTLTQVPVSQSPIIANLMQLYKYDFSEFAQIGSPYGEVGSDGRFVYDGLDSYWREDGRIPLTVQADDRLAGFILVNRWSALSRKLDHSVAEFFVLRKYRLIGVGSRAARVLFERWPGRWEVPVASYNKPALFFWRKAIPASVDGTVEEYAGDGKRWVGTVLCFDNRVRKSY